MISDSADFTEPTFNQPPAASTPLRMSDSDRRATVRTLDQALAEGRLTTDEHRERVGQANAARFASDLEPLTADLVAVRDSHRADDDLVPMRPAGTTPIVPINYGSNSISSILSERKRDGGWRVPGRLNVSSIMGSVKLDMRRATFDTAEVIIDATVVMGEIKIWVPKGTRVTDDTHPIMAEVKVKRLGEPQPGRPHLRLLGKLIMGEIIVIGGDQVTLSDRIAGRF